MNTRRRPNVDRMRRHADRALAAHASRDALARLAAMTPEHRAVHERGALCADCLCAALASAFAPHRAVVTLRPVGGRS